MSDVKMKLKIKKMARCTLKTPCSVKLLHKRSMNNLSLHLHSKQNKENVHHGKSCYFIRGILIAEAPGASERYLLDSQPFGELTDCHYQRNKWNSLC